MRIYEASLPQTSASFHMGIVFGIKQGMTEEFKDTLSETVVYHVVATSGMNHSSLVHLWCYLARLCSDRRL